MKSSAFNRMAVLLAAVVYSALSKAPTRIPRAYNSLENHLLALLGVFLLDPLPFALALDEVPLFEVGHGVLLGADRKPLS